MSNTPRLKPSDIDIRPFRPKNRLNPDFFDSDGSMNSRIRLGLLDIADDFVRMLEVKWVKPIDIVVTGSMVNYNWSKFSDVDIHIIYDFSKIYKKGEFVKDYFDAKKKCWNDSHQELTVKGFPVEISVEDVKEPAKSSGVYSLEKNKWVEEPKELDASELDTEKIKKFCAKKMGEMDAIFAKMDKEKDRKKLENLTKDLESVYDELKGMRKNGLASKEMEMSEGNIIWKVIKHAGYIDKCWDYYDKVYDRRNTIDEAVSKTGPSGKPTAYLMIGMPGSGKSTWVKNNLPNLPVVSRDIIRGYEEVGVSKGVDDKKVGNKDQETLVTDIERREIKELCKKGEDFVVDDTNTGKYRKGMVDYIRSCGARVVGIYVETDAETCKSRRDGVIPGDAMDRMFGRMVKPNAEEFDDFKVVSGNSRTVVISESQMRGIKNIALMESTNESGRGRKHGSLLLEGDSRLKQVEAIIRSEFQGLLDPDATVRSVEYQVNGNPNTTWLSFLTYSLRHEFGLMTNADVKYLPLVAKLAFSDAVGFQKRDDNGRELGILKRIVVMLKKDDTLFQKVKSANPSFGELYNALKTQIESEMQSERKAADSVEEHGGYRIVDVPDFQTANLYGNRSCSQSKLCYTQGKNTWDNWTNGGLNRAYVCLRDGWENEPEVPSEGNPYDAYGTSMIFAFISPEGRLVRSNCRWNHHVKGEYGPGGCDQAFTEETLARTVGRRFSATFQPWPPEKLKAMGYVSFEEAERRLKAGEDPRYVFDWCDAFSDGYAKVKLNGKWNFIGKDGELLSPNQWFDWCDAFSDGYTMVELNGKFNFIGTDGRLVSPNQWFDWCDAFSDGYAMVKLNGKQNFIGKDGELLSPNQWFDWCYDFSDGYAMVQLNGKFNFIGTDGRLVSPNQWFDWCDAFSDGYAMVKLNGKQNFIGKDGELLSPNQWFDWCYDFSDGYAMVQLNGKFNFIGTDGELLWKRPVHQWFDNCINFIDGYASVALNREWNIIDTDGRILSPNQWFDYCYAFRNGYARVILNGKDMYIDTNGNLYNQKPTGRLNESLDEAAWPDFNPHEIEKIPYFAQRVRWCEKNLGPFFGSGSARMIFEIDDEKVLKLAKNQKGIAQNEAEVDTSRYSDCVVKCFEWADDYSWVIEENCIPARKSDFQRLLSIDFDTFCDLLVYQHSMYSRRRFWYSKLKNDDEAYELVNKLYDEDEYGFVLQVMDLMANYILPFGDLTRISSYGLVKRDGVPEIVIIDSGLNNDIYDTYYQRRR